VGKTFIKNKCTKRKVHRREGVDARTAACTRQAKTSRELTQRTSATVGVVGHFGDVGAAVASAAGHAAPGAVGAAVVTATAAGTAVTAARFAGGRGAREPAAGHVGERFVVRVGVPVVRVVLVHAAELVVVRRQRRHRRGRHRVGRR